MKLKPDSFKGYTIGDNTNKHLSKWPFRLDDEKLMYPFYERLVKWSKASPSHGQCLHPQRPLPAVDREEVSAPARILRRARCGQSREGLAAAQFHHLPLGLALDRTGRAQVAWEHFEKTGRIEWVTDLAEIPEKYGVKNVYGDLGQLFAWSTTANPRLGAAVMGTLIKGLGADHVVWGTDAVWTGSPQWQIEALRRLEIPEDMQKKYGYTAARRGRRPGQDRDLRRQQCAALPGLAEAAGRSADRPHGAGQGHLREARARAQPTWPTAISRRKPA